MSKDKAPMGERLAAIELEHRLALAEKQNAALESKLAECVAALETAEKYLTSCGYGIKEADREPEDYMLIDFREVLAKVKK